LTETPVRAVSAPVLGLLIFLLALGARLPIAITKPLDGDEAVQGIAALRLLDHGDWSWFFPGQRYAGMLETIPQALLQAFDKGNVFLLRLPLVLIAAAAVLLLACLALELTRSSLTFVAVGGLAALFPPAYVYLGSWQTAGYNSSIFLGVLAAYLLARALRPTLLKQRRLLLIGAAGLSAGLAVYQQPLSAFVIAALGTTVLVATWPSAVNLLGFRHLAAFAGLALLGASPQIIAALSGVEANTANNPIPPGYDLSPEMLLAVIGLPIPGDSPTLEYIGLPGGHESMTWNALGVQGLHHNLLVPEALAVALSGAAWGWVLGTLGWALARRYSSRSRIPAADPEGSPRERRAASLYVAIAAGALAGGLVVILAIVRLPPLSKYAFGLCGFASFGLAVIATRHRGRTAVTALLAVGFVAVMAASAFATMKTFYDEEESDADDQRSWLLSEIRAISTPPGGTTAIYGDYWIAYPLEFMSGSTAQAQVPSFDRFPERDPGGEAPAGRVIVPIIPELPFQAEVDTALRDNCTVRSRESDGDATLLVAQCDR
jgi:hypothetical protein